MLEIPINVEDHFDGKVEISRNLIFVTNEYHVIKPTHLDMWASVNITDIPEILHKVIEFVVETERAKYETI